MTIYSINLASYIMAATGFVPAIEYKDDGFYVFVYPDCEAVDVCVDNYRDRKLYFDLKEFLFSFRKIKTLIKNESEVN